MSSSSMHNKIEALSKARTEDVWSAVIDTDIHFNPLATSSQLIALIFLSHLGLLPKFSVPNFDFVNQVAAWCKLPRERLKHDLMLRCLDASGSHWECVERLVRAS
jgi:hypothetical protein